MYLLWLIPEFYIRRGEDSLALQSREGRKRGDKQKGTHRRTEGGSKAEKIKGRGTVQAVWCGDCGGHIGWREQTKQECTSANIFFRSGRRLLLFFFPLLFLLLIPMCGHAKLKPLTILEALYPLIYLFIYVFIHSFIGARKMECRNTGSSIPRPHLHITSMQRQKKERALIQVERSPEATTFLFLF